LTDGVQYYRAACRMLNLRHYVYDSRARNLMERIVQHVKDRMGSFDTYRVGGWGVIGGMLRCC